MALAARSEPLPRPESPSVLLFGRLEQYKGVEVLVEAMRLVWTRRPDVTLVVAGAGEAARLVPDDPRISLIPRYIPESEVDDAARGSLPCERFRIPRRARAGSGSWRSRPAFR